MLAIHRTRKSRKILFDSLILTSQQTAKAPPKETTKMATTQLYVVELFYQIYIKFIGFFVYFIDQMGSVLLEMSQ